MRLLIVAGDLVPTGGQDAANLALARYAARQGAEVHVVAHRVDPALTEQDSVIWHRVPRPRGRHLLGMPLLAEAGRRWARRLGSGTTVLVNGGNCPGVEAPINWVHYVHAADPGRHDPGASALRKLKSWGFAAAERRALRRARRIVANSQRTRRDLVEHLRIDPDRIEVVYYGSDPARFPPIAESERAEAKAARPFAVDGRPVVLFVGALGDGRKGLDVLLEAWRTLRAADPTWDAQLAIAGTGARLTAYRAECAADSSIHFLGFCSDVPNLLAASDLLVSPARYEAYGLNVHEALCRGIPVLASAEAGVAERFGPAARDWLLDDVRDPRVLVVRLRTWRDRRGEWSRTAQALSQEFHAWTWDDCCRAILGDAVSRPVENLLPGSCGATSG